MVLNVKNLNQNSDKRYEQNFDWGKLAVYANVENL